MRNKAKQTKRVRDMTCATTRTGSIMALVFLVGMLIVSCAPTQPRIPLAERAALENQRAQQAGRDSLGTGETGRPGNDGITEQDITGRDGIKSPAPGTQATGSIRDVYFDFDSYTLKNADLPPLKEFAAWMKANSGVRVTIEGHCDERGSIEYNLALGQKRAEAVREYLVRSGVAEGRIKGTSYGKEIPADTGHTEEAWARNRRAHIKIE